MNIFLRPATAQDGDGILATHVAALLELCAADYSAAQLQAWTSQLTTATYQPAITAHFFLVAQREEEVVGFTEYDAATGEIVAVYVHPRHARLGLGTMLYQAIERHARESGRKELHLISSLTAVPFYARFGFIAGPAVVRHLEDGTELAAIPMRKQV